MSSRVRDQLFARGGLAPQEAKQIKSAQEAIRTLSRDIAHLGNKLNEQNRKTNERLEALSRVTGELEVRMSIAQAQIEERSQRFERLLNDQRMLHGEAVLDGQEAVRNLQDYVDRLQGQTRKLFESLKGTVEIGLSDTYADVQKLVNRVASLRVAFEYAPEPSQEGYAWHGPPAKVTDTNVRMRLVQSPGDTKSEPLRFAGAGREAPSHVFRFASGDAPPPFVSTALDPNVSPDDKRWTYSPVATGKPIWMIVSRQHGETLLQKWSSPIQLH